MAKGTGIEWTDATWNPIRGCSRVSEGCRNCYAEQVAARFSGPRQPYEHLATFKVIDKGLETEHVESRAGPARSRSSKNISAIRSSGKSRSACS